MDKTATDRGLNGWLKQIGPAQALQGVMNLQPDAAWFAVDADRQIIFWSEGAENLLGFSADDVVGDHCLRANRCSECMQGCGIAEHGSVHDIKLTMVNSLGDSVPVLKTARAFFDEGGAFIGGIEVFRADSAAASSPTLPVLPVQTPGSHADDGKEFHGILTRDHALREALDVLANVAKSDVTVLIRGESGTGKELIARALHAESRRKKGPFVAVNCAALSPALLESELFGHERGAFSGAVARHHGVFEQADGGTLFLDEVAELPLELQAKLLRALQERTFQRVGGKKAIEVDVRIVSATHRSLRELVAEGLFREDLMYRLRVVPLYLPPLRERRGDIQLLTDRFIQQLNTRSTRQVRAVGPDAQRLMLDHAWPGNVRELQNVLEYAFAVGRGPEIISGELPPEFRGASTPAMRGSPVAPLPRRRRRYRAPRAPGDEARAISSALETSHGDVGEAAAALGMSRATFWRRRKQYGIEA